MDTIRPVPLPIIQCTPPTDPDFLTVVVRAFNQAVARLSGDLEVLVDTLVRIRVDYPMAAIVAVPDAVLDGEPCYVWLVARDGWTDVNPPGFSTATPPEEADQRQPPQ
jgi:hypothetical protein